MIGCWDSWCTHTYLHLLFEGHALSHPGRFPYWMWYQLKEFGLNLEVDWCGSDCDYFTKVYLDTLPNLPPPGSPIVYTTPYCIPYSTVGHSTTSCYIHIVPILHAQYHSSVNSLAHTTVLYIVPIPVSLLHTPYHSSTHVQGLIPLHTPLLNQRNIQYLYLSPYPL